MHANSVRGQQPGEIVVDRLTELSQKVTVEESRTRSPQQVWGHTVGQAESPSVNAFNAVPNARPRGYAEAYLDPYRMRNERIAEAAGSGLNGFDASINTPQDGPLAHAGDLSPMWWEELVGQPLGFAQQTLSIDVLSLTTSALANSPQIRSLLAEPQIRQTDVTIADAQFDTLLFLDGRFVNADDPVGSELTTGDNSDRFLDRTFSSNLGLRKRGRNGGKLELTQRGGFQENNSIFLQPNPQGTTRLELNYTQPLRKDAGRMVNQAGIIVAQLQANQASSETRLSLEEHLLEVTRAYWELYRVRSKWLQQQKLIGSARQLHGVLDARRGFDAGRRQILRARSALASRQVGLSRAASQIKDAQARLRMLVGSTELVSASRAEWTTSERPMEGRLVISEKHSVFEALENRSDITKAIQAIHEVSVRVGAARNQVLPQLDLLLGTYVAGLDAGRDSLGAFENQFTDGRPGFSIGLAYEMPVGNRAAKSRLNRNRWELFQVIQDFRQVTEAAITEVEIAARETKTAYNEMLEKRLAIEATQSEIGYLTQRYNELPGEEDSLILLIDNLLTSQERLAQQEGELTDAQVSYALSWIILKKAKGVLLQMDTTPQPEGCVKTASRGAALSGAASGEGERFSRGVK